MIRFSTPEFRKNFVLTYLKEKQKNAELSISLFTKNNFPDVGIKSAYNWVRKYKRAEGKVLNMTENEVNGLFGCEANSMSIKDKLKMVLDTAGLNDEQVGAYCRQHGIYKSDLDSWKIECLSALDENSGTVNHKQQKTEIKELKQKVSRLEKECVKKDKEIDRKDKALATYAAQISTLKKISQTLHQQQRGRLTDGEEKSKVVGFIKDCLITPVSVDIEALGISEKYSTIRLDTGFLCKMMGIGRATFYRWIKCKEDKRKGRVHRGLMKYSPEHEARVLLAVKLNPALTPDELIAMYLDMVDENGNNIGFYLGSRSYIRH